MNREPYQSMLRELPRRLAELLGVPAEGVTVRQGQAGKRGARVCSDLLASGGRFKFVIEWKARGYAADVTMALRSLSRYAENASAKGIPLLVVPYMGEVGRSLCEAAHVNWLDLSGNAHVVAPGLRVNIAGKPDRFKRPGRPRSAFAPKSARIARWLLIKSDHAFTQAELAKLSGLDQGFTSRIVRQLEEQRLVARDSQGKVQVAEYDAMLDAWREVYNFSRHHIVRGHIAARSGDDVVRRLSSELKHGGIDYAATGLAGAWLLNPFAGFRLVVFYVNRLPSAEEQQRVEFREEQRGENVWLVLPNDDGVFQGSEERQGVRCAHPVQVYLDLKNHPERSAEAAAQLRAKFLRKGGHA